uniref:caspase-14-like n=1 Tax=Pristiophorus japonicus TaxID=55135 RepID=UPI00398F4D5D
MALTVREAILCTLQQLEDRDFIKFRSRIAQKSVQLHWLGDVVNWLLLLGLDRDDVTDRLIGQFGKAVACQLVIDTLQCMKQKRTLSYFLRSLQSVGHQDSAGAAPQRDLTGSEDCYDMSGYCRAFVLVVQQGRAGAENELLNLRKFSRDFNFSITECVDPTNKEIIPALEEFRDEMSAKVSCSFVFIMAHGELGKIFGINDRRGVKLEKIISLFDNANCRALQRKPKVFVIQACRGEESDPGVEYFVDSHQANCQTSEPKKLPTLSDTFIVYPAQPGYVAYRKGVRGSLMVTHMMKVLKHFGTTLHLSDLFVKVNQKMTREELTDMNGEDVKTVLVMESTLTKSVYFTGRD